MTSSGDVAVETKRTSFLELFFDLVFVFAITQLAGMLHADHTATGWGRAALIAWLVWWAWSQYTWAGNAIDLDRRPVRVAVLGVTGTMLLAAQAMPAAFGPDGIWFAVPYVVVRAAGLALYWAGLAGDAQHRAALRTYLPVAAVSPALVLAGGVAPESVRPWVWLAAVAVDVASAIAGGRGEFRISPTHFAERRALIVIIALGESVIAVGATTTELPTTAALVTAAAAGFAIVAALWWSYFDWVQAAAEHRLATEPDHRRRGRLARDLFTFAHLPIVVGPVIFAVGVEEVLVHPTEVLPAFGRLAIGAGITLFLVGFVAGNARATGHLLPERTAAVVGVPVVVATAGAAVRGVVLLALLAIGLVAIAAVETRRRRATGR